MVCLSRNSPEFRKVMDCGTIIKPALTMVIVIVIHSDSLASGCRLLADADPGVQVSIKGLINA